MPPRESGRDANHRPYLDGSTQGRGIRAPKHITDRTSSTVASVTMLHLGNGGWHSHDSRCQALSLPVRCQNSV